MNKMLAFIFLLFAVAAQSATVSNVSISGSVQVSGAVNITNSVLPTLDAPGFTISNYYIGSQIIITNSVAGCTFYWTTNGWANQHEGSVISNMVAGTASAYATKAFYNSSTTNTTATFTNAPTCDSTEDQYSIVPSGTGNIGSASNRWYFGGYYTNSASVNICKLAFCLTKNGSITGKTLNAQIWTLTGTTLNAEQGKSDDVTGDNGWSSTWVDFNFSSPVAITAETRYAITLTQNSADAVNYISCLTGTTNSTMRWSYARWNDPSTKTVADSSEASEMSIKVYYYE